MTSEWVLPIAGGALLAALTLLYWAVASEWERCARRRGGGRRGRR